MGDGGISLLFTWRWVPFVNNLSTHFAQVNTFSQESSVFPLAKWVSFYRDFFILFSPSGDAVVDDGSHKCCRIIMRIYSSIIHYHVVIICIYVVNNGHTVIGTVFMAFRCFCFCDKLIFDDH